MRAADGRPFDAGVHIDHRVALSRDRRGPARGRFGHGMSRGPGVDRVERAWLRAGIIDETGMMRDAESLRALHSSADQDGQDLAERIHQEGRQRSFHLVRPEAGVGGRPVIVTQRDVRELQLAKGAIRAGI